MALSYEEKECGAPVRKCKRIRILEGKRGWGRPKKSLDDVIRED